MKRYSATITVWIEASDEGEAETIAERAAQAVGRGAIDGITGADVDEVEATGESDDE